MASRPKRKVSTGNRAGMGIIALVVGVLIVALIIQSIKLNHRIVSYRSSNAALESRIQEEKDRAEDLKNLPAYVNSDEYIEKAAREKFGLVYEDEIIFKPEE